MPKRYVVNFSIPTGQRLTRYRDDKAIHDFDTAEAAIAYLAAPWLTIKATSAVARDIETGKVLAIRKNGKPVKVIAPTL